MKMALKNVNIYTKLKKIGPGSAFVLIPKLLRELMKIKPGDELQMSYNLHLNRIVITTIHHDKDDDKDKDI